MKKMPSSGSEYKDVYLGFFDLLGFSDFVEHGNFNKVYQKLIQLLHISNIMRGFGGIPTERSTIESGHKHPLLKSIAMSDSLILFTGNTDLNSLVYLAGVSADLISVGMSGLLPIRGAISKGKFYADYNSGIFFGPAIVEAVRVEKVANWAGVVLAPSCTLKAKSKQYRDIESFVRTASESQIIEGKGEKSFLIKAPLIVEYEVPERKGRRKMLCVNWPFPKIYNPKADILLRAFVSSGAGLSEEAETKHKNTVAFHMYCDGLIDKEGVQFQSNKRRGEDHRR